MVHLPASDIMLYATAFCILMSFATGWRFALFVFIALMFWRIWWSVKYLTGYTLF
jgi:hypothetical protein